MKDREKALLAIVAGLGLLVWFQLPKPQPSLHDLAENAIEAFADRNFSALLRMQSPEEFKQLKMTDRQWYALLRWAREDVLRGVSFDPDQAERNKSKAFGEGKRTLRLGDRSATLRSISIPTSSGPRVCLSPLVLGSLFRRAELDGETSAASPWQLQRVASAARLRRHQPQMAQMGFTHFLDANADAKPTSIESLIQLLERTAAMR